MKQALKTQALSCLGIVPRMDVEGRGMIPEIEIKYEEFGAQAIDAAEKYIDLDLLAKVAKPPHCKLRLITKRLWKNSKIYSPTISLNASQGGKTKSCS